MRDHHVHQVFQQIWQLSTLYLSLTRSSSLKLKVWLRGCSRDYAFRWAESQKFNFANASKFVKFAKIETREIYIHYRRFHLEVVHVYYTCACDGEMHCAGT